MKKSIILLFVYLLIISCNKDTGKNFADSIILNANVYTLSWDAPFLNGKPANNAPFQDGKWQFDAQAIAIKNNTIQFVGSNKKVESYIGSETEVIDAKQAVIIPGLIESHGHLQELGEKKEAINLENLTKQQIVDLIIKRANETPKGEWIIASGWDEAVFANDYLDMVELSKHTPNNPVVLIGLRGFGAMGNKLAFEKAGITKTTKATDGGENLKDNKGNLKFILLNSAKKLLLDKIPKKTLAQQTRIIEYGFNELLKLGFTTTHHAGVAEEHMDVYEDLLKKNKLPMRIHAFVAARMYNINLVNKWLKKGPTKNDESFLQVRNFKAYYDGSLGSRGAKFLEDYSDKKGHTGLVDWPMAFMKT